MLPKPALTGVKLSKPMKAHVAFLALQQGASEGQIARFFMEKGMAAYGLNAWVI